MTRLPIWMLAFVVTGCFSKTIDDNDDDDDWGDESGEERWNGGTGEATGTGGSSEGSSEGSSGGESGSEASGGDGGPDCEVEGVVSSYPEGDGGDFYYRGHVEFVFDGIDEDATITLIGGTEGDIPGTTSWKGNTLSFAPAVPLFPMSWYTAQLAHCAGEATIGFTTSALGTPLEDSADLVGKSYVIDLDSARFVEPAGVGSLLFGLLEEYILLGVNSVSETEIEMIGAVSKSKEDPAQNTCEPSITFPTTVDFSAAPFFSVGPEDIALSTAGINTIISDFRIAGDFAADGSYIGGAILSGFLDARDLASVLVDSGLITDDDPNEVCDLIATFGVACEACSDGREYCLDIYIDEITANEGDQTLLEVETCDVETCDEGCGE